MSAADFAYRLSVLFEPDWKAILRRLISASSEHELKSKIDLIQRGLSDSAMMNRHYRFNEYFESRTGLTIRFQRVVTKGGSHSDCVTEFRDCGRLIEGDANELVPKGQENTFSIEVTEQSIRNECFDEFIGGISPWMDGVKFFSIALDPMVEFAVQLGLRFPGLNCNAIMKWPESIEKGFRAAGIEYRTDFDGKPQTIDTETHREFLESCGEPIIAVENSVRYHYFKAECAFYAFNVEVFTAASNPSRSRFTGTSLFVV